jgi:hypothetical protein
MKRDRKLPFGSFEANFNGITYDTVVTNLERANTRLHIIECVVAILVCDQLAVNVAHGVFLGHLVEDDFGAGYVGD